MTRGVLEDIRSGRREEKVVVAKRRIPKKKLREPDEFITWGSRAMNYALDHIRHIGLGFLLIGVIIVGFILWRQHLAAGEEQAFTLLGKGIRFYHQEEKIGEALHTFSEVIKDHRRTKAGEVALLYRGRCYMLQEEYDRAIEDFDLFLKRSSTAFLRPIALNALGNAYIAKGDYGRAVDHFQQVLASGEEWLKPHVLIQMGMCWEKLGEESKASEAYQESLKMVPPDPWANLVRLRLKKLEGKTK